LNAQVLSDVWRFARLGICADLPYDKPCS
jgi:hypothetical protein